MNQHELFEDLSLVEAKPGTEFAEFRIGNKIIPVPLSFWKDGRTRADLSAYGAGEIVSRNRSNLEQRVVGALGLVFETLVEAVREEFARGQPPRTRPRSSNKRPLQNGSIARQRQ